MLVGLAYTFSQDGTRATERDFNFDGFEFQAGASLDTELSVDTYILDVMYSLYQTDRAEIMFGGGIHAIDLEASISGRAVDALNFPSRRRPMSAPCWHWFMAIRCASA